MDYKDKPYTQSRESIREEREAWKLSPEQREQASKEALAQLLPDFEAIPYFISSSRDPGYYAIASYVMDIAMQYDDAYHHFEPEYNAQTLKLSFQLFKNLTPTDFRVLKLNFQQKVSQAVAERGLSMHPHLERVLDPDSNYNVLQHEFDHLIVLPPFAQQDAQIHLHFSHNQKQVDVGGKAWIEVMAREQLTPQQNAHTAANPQVLSGPDVEIAKRYLRKIKSKGFKKRFNVWLRGREKIEQG